MSANPEDRLSKDAKYVLVTLRAEAAAHRIPPNQAAYLEKSVKVYDAIGFLGTFALKLSAFIIAISSGYLAFKGWFK